MPTFAWILIGFFVAWVLIIAVIFTFAVRSGKLKLKKGGAPGTGSGSNWQP